MVVPARHQGYGDYKKVDIEGDVQLTYLDHHVSEHDKDSNPVSPVHQEFSPTVPTQTRVKQQAVVEEKSGPLKTVVTIFISFVGAGVLGLPYAYLKSGFLMGTTCLVLVSGMSLHCMMLLLQCKHKLEDKGARTYSEVASMCLGPKFKRATELLLLVSQTGFCVAYLIFIATNLVPFTGAKKAVHVLVVLPFLVSLAMLPSLTALAPVSTAANLCNMMGMVVVLWDDVSSFKHHEHIVPITSLAKLPFMFGVSVYCFEGIGMILPMEEAMADRSKFPRLLTLTVWAISAIFIAFGLMGYVAFGPHTEDIVTLNLPKHWTTTLMILSVCTALVFTFPVMMVPVYEIIERNLAAKEWFEKNVSPPNFAYVFRFIRACVVCGVAFVAVSVPGFGDFISLIGSLCCGLLAFVVPSACHLALFKDDLPWWKKLADMSLIAFGIVAAAFGTWDSVSSMYS
uniref:Solute carrier family 36 (Proton-coupled amino acid transporter), member 1 n=1 Tax=Tetraselmis sp. GSL018 TaxID=582737 RepID=A0A061R4W6_9CHLO|mmetsp:Transcript_7975/g.19054  ORF Transcript_7975/g.19054 Transcript_7975/m.19054 type:complete len:454 (-) Transcript_7975:385-1746(-)